MKKRFLDRPLSHSQLATWEWSPEQWYNSYILGLRGDVTPNMTFGSLVGDSIGTPDSMVPDLKPPGTKEYKLEATVEGIPLIGYADHYCPDTRVLHENKTTDNKSKWTKGKANKHTQIDMYLLMLYLSEGIPPETVTCYLNAILTKQVGVGYRLHDPVEWRQHRLDTKTIADLDNYQTYLLATVEAMQDYITKRELSTPAPNAPAFRMV